MKLKVTFDRAAMVRAGRDWPASDVIEIDPADLTPTEREMLAQSIRYDHANNATLAYITYELGSESVALSLTEPTLAGLRAELARAAAVIAERTAAKAAAAEKRRQSQLADVGVVRREEISHNIGGVYVSGEFEIPVQIFGSDLPEECAAHNRARAAAIEAAKRSLEPAAAAKQAERERERAALNAERAAYIERMDPDFRRRVARGHAAVDAIDLAIQDLARKDLGLTVGKGAQSARLLELTELTANQYAQWEIARAVFPEDRFVLTARRCYDERDAGFDEEGDKVRINKRTELEIEWTAADVTVKAYLRLSGPTEYGELPSEYVARMRGGVETSVSA